MGKLKILAKILLIFLLAFHLGPLLAWALGLTGYFTVAKTYIGHINTPTHPETAELLESLNHRGYGEVVKYEGLRPIIIAEENLNKIENPNGMTLGSAWILPGYCLILLDPSIDDPDVWRQTVWHEYLHCFYYGHSSDKRDIMYAELSPWIKESSVDNYLKELKELYEQR